MAKLVQWSYHARPARAQIFLRAFVRRGEAVFLLVLLKIPVVVRDLRRGLSISSTSKSMKGEGMMWVVSCIDFDNSCTCFNAPRLARLLLGSFPCFCTCKGSLRRSHVDRHIHPTVAQLALQYLTSSSCLDSVSIHLEEGLETSRSTN